MKLQDFLVLVLLVCTIVGWTAFAITMIFNPMVEYIFAFIISTAAAVAFAFLIFLDANTLNKVIFTRRNKRK